MSSKVLPVLSFIAAEVLRRMQICTGDLHGPRAESRHGSSLLAGKKAEHGGRAAAHTASRSAHVLSASAFSVFIFAVARAARAPYFVLAAVAYLRRNLSTRPAVSTIFCLPV